jgi:hypothetical protein
VNLTIIYFAFDYPGNAGMLGDKDKIKIMAFYKYR